MVIQIETLLDQLFDFRSQSGVVISNLLTEQGNDDVSLMLPEYVTLSYEMIAYASEEIVDTVLECKLLSLTHLDGDPLEDNIYTVEQDLGRLVH